MLFLILYAVFLFGVGVLIAFFQFPISFAIVIWLNLSFFPFLLTHWPIFVVLNAIVWFALYIFTHYARLIGE